MKRSKILSILLAVTLAVTCFAGCGQKPTTVPTEPSVKTTGEAQTAPSETSKPIEMTKISIWSGSKGTQATFERLAEEFNQGEGKELGIEIEYVVQADFSKVTELAMQNGEGPDFTETVGSVANMAEKGYVVPITELPGADEFVQRYVEAGVLEENKSTYHGEIYSVASSVTTRGLVYNKDMFKAAGIVDKNGEPTPPTTLKEMREYAARLTDVSKGQYGIIFPLKDNYFVNTDCVSMLMGSVGFDQFNPVTGKYDYSGFIPIIEAFQGMMADGSVYPGVEGYDNDTARAYFSQGCVGMKIAFSFDVAVFNDQFPATCDWGVAPLPVIDENETYYHNMKVSPAVYLTSAALETKDPEKLMKVYEWYNSDYVKQTLYAEGTELPWDFGIVDGVELVTEKKGWREFAALANISMAPNAKPSYDLASKPNLNDRIISEVLSGKRTIQEVIEEYNIDINDGVKRYYETNTDVSLDNFLISDWDTRR